MKKRFLLLPAIALLSLSACGGNKTPQEEEPEYVETRKGFIESDPFTMEEALEAVKNPAEDDRYADIYIKCEVLESEAYGGGFIVKAGDEKKVFIDGEVDRDIKDQYVQGPNAMKGAEITVKTYMNKVSEITNERQKVLGSDYKVANATIIGIDKTNIATPAYRKCTYSFYPYEENSGKPVDEETETATDLAGYDVRQPGFQYYLISDNKVAHTRYISKIIVTGAHIFELKDSTKIKHFVGGEYDTNPHYSDYDDVWQIEVDLSGHPVPSYVFESHFYIDEDDDRSVEYRSEIFMISFDLVD